MDKKAALYIHIPFCRSKCLYCDFPSYSEMEGYMLKYCLALLKEIEKIGDIEVSSIFIGGGTPTYLSLEGWNLIKSGINKLNKNENVEFTVEGNPGTFDYEKLKFLKEMGVNRLSIGLQAWQNSLLKNIGRIHSVEDFIKSFQMARSIGFENINIDLMFGLPGQSIKQWGETLENAVEINPEHISCYSLILEEGTPLMDMYLENNIYLPSEEEEREMYQIALNILAKANYNQYEISNFSKVGRECKHNIIYWETKEYIGCGASAHSFINGKRFSNEINIIEYINKINLLDSAVKEVHINTEKDNIEEYIFMGLRMIRGISIKEFKTRFHRDINLIYGNVINKYEKTGLLAVDQDRIYLTPKGIELSNLVMAEFIL